MRGGRGLFLEAAGGCFLSPAGGGGGAGAPGDLASSGELNSPCGKLLALGQNACAHHLISF